MGGVPSITPVQCAIYARETMLSSQAKEYANLAKILSTCTQDWWLGLLGFFFIYFSKCIKRSNRIHQHIQEFT